MYRLLLLAAAVLSLSVGVVGAQSSRSYDEGHVVEVSSIRVKDGQWDNYMAYLAGPYKTLLDAQMNAGIIVDWDAYSVQPRTPQERNLILTVTYANMAALDGLEDKTEPLTESTLGQDRAQGEKNYADRATMREVLGSQLIRELKLR